MQVLTELKNLTISDSTNRDNDEDLKKYCVSIE